MPDTVEKTETIEEIETVTKPDGEEIETITETTIETEKVKD